MNQNRKHTVESINFVSMVTTMYNLNFVYVHSFLPLPLFFCVINDNTLFLLVMKSLEFSCHHLHLLFSIFSRMTYNSSHMIFLHRSLFDPALVDKTSYYSNEGFHSSSCRNNAGTFFYLSLKLASLDYHYGSTDVVFDPAFLDLKLYRNMNCPSSLDNHYCDTSVLFSARNNDEGFRSRSRRNNAGTFLFHLSL